MTQGPPDRTQRNRAPASVWRDPVHFLAFGFGAGAVPYAPGTFGTLVGVPLYLLLEPLSDTVYAAVVIAMFAAGVWLCGRTGRQTGVIDHPGIVWDEIVGFLITMFMVPAGWPWVVAGFILFRVFDILKPFPIGLVDRKSSGGFGVMMDDVIAGVYAALVLHLAAAYLAH